MKTKDFDYYLPEELIAQTPLEKRDESRLMCLDKETGELSHHHFYELPDFLNPGDCLILNNSRVLPARLLGQRLPGGGACEVLLLIDRGDKTWECIVRPGKHLRKGAKMQFGNGELKAEVVDVLPDGNRMVKFDFEGIFLEVLEHLGKMPLPPYIKEELQDQERYQTVYSKVPGSAAALRGQDYPFPTVLTQGTACLHYGEWPSRGLYWSSGVLSLDRITTPSVTLSLHFTQDTGADAVPVITCSRKGIVDVSVPQAQTPPADVRHSYAVTLTGLSVGSTEVFATLGDYTARLLVSVTSTLDISVDGLPGDDFFVGATCNLTLTARDSHGSALDVNWTVTPQYGNSVLTASVPVTKADRTASVTLTATGEGEDRTMVTATYTAGGESFTSKLPLVLPVRMQGVLGIANTSDEPPVYQQGVMNKDGTAFTDDVPSGAPYTDRPAYAGAKLYLYSRGSAATFDGLSVSGVTVKGGADATEYVLRPMPVSNDEDTSVLHPDVFRAENDDFRVTVGTPAKDTTSAFTYRPLTVKGRSQGQITLTVTLTDAENHAFTLSIPYTLTEEDTRVTATLRVDEQAFTLSVPYGTAPTAEDVARLLTDNGISPDTIDSWTPDITQPLYADTAFTAVRKTTDSGGAPTVPDADTPASGSKDPEDTPSDDPSAPDSSSSGTDPTPEPSPDTLP